MKAVFKYLFAICILFLIGNGQLFARASAESAYDSLAADQQVPENLDAEIVGLEQNNNAKALLPVTVEITSPASSEFEEEDKQSIFLDGGLYYSRFARSLSGTSNFYDNTFISYPKKRLCYPSCRRYLLFEVFRI